MAAVEAAVFGLCVIIFVSWCIQWYMHILAILYGKWRLHRKTEKPEEVPLPGVSILKPLTGIDPNLYENLDTFFKMDYPKYEVLFCVEEESDPAIMVVKSLQDKYTTIDSKLFVGAKRVGINPKINNMIQGYEAAKYDYILISDSGLKMKEDTLLDMVLTMKDNIGLVHQMPFVCDREDFSGILEKVHFGTQFGKMYLNADFLGINSVTGMSCLIRKEILTETGGLQSLSQFLAEDYYLGQKCLESGFKIRISSQPAWQNAGGTTVSSFQSRMTRWIKLRSSIVPSIIVLEPLAECLVLGALSSWAVTVVFNWSGLAFFFVHSLLWFMLDYVLLQIIQNEPLPFSKFEMVIAWLYKEMSSMCVILKAHSSHNLVWRNKVFKLYWGGVGEEVRTNSTKLCV